MFYKWIFKVIIFKYMTQDNKKMHFFKNILESFDSKCKQNDIWYSLGEKTLLSVITENDYYSHDNFLEVLMTNEGFEKLKFHYKENLLDNSLNSLYLHLNPIYFEIGNKVTIKIFIIVPASIKKTEKIYSLFNQIRCYVSYNVSIPEIKKIKKIWVKKISLLFQPITWQEIYAKIYKEKYQGYFVIGNFNSNINANWIPSLTFKMENKNFLNVDVPIIREYELYLHKKFGSNWMNFIDKKRKKNSNWINDIIEKYYLLEE